MRLVSASRSGNCQLNRRHALGRLFGLLLGLYVLAFLLIVVVLVATNIVNKRDFAEQVAFSQTKPLLYGDMQSVVWNLGKTAERYFSLVGFVDTKNNVSFCISDVYTPARCQDAILTPGLVEWRVIHPVKFEENGPVLGSFVFVFPLHDVSPIPLVVWLALLPAILFLFWRSQGRIIERWEREAQVAREAAVGRISSQLCHDLKSPLLTVESVSAASSWDEFRRLQPQLNASISRLHSMIDGLKSSNIEMVVKPILANIDFSDWVNLVAGAVRSGSSSIGISGQAIVEKVFVDEPKLLRAFSNIVLNAVESGAKSIEISSFREGDDLHIEVSNDGPPVSAEIVPRLFSRGATHGKEGGTGLGLASVASVARGHGGRAFHELREGRTVFGMILANAFVGAMSAELSATCEAGELEADASREEGEKRVGERSLVKVFVRLDDERHRQAILAQLEKQHEVPTLLLAAASEIPECPAIVYCEASDEMAWMGGAGIAVLVAAEGEGAEAAAARIRLRARTLRQPG